MGDRDSLVVVEQNLLSVIDPTKRVPRRFDLGMSDFVGSDAFDENQDPTPRKLSLALKKRPKEPSSESAKAKKPRKALQASVSNEINEADYERMAVPFVPANTKIMFKMVGIEGKTNHSLRASGATEMFRAGVPEKIIQEHTGHRSVKALRTYERTTATQHLSVANVLSSSSNVSFSDAKDKPPSANGTATAMSVNSTTGIPGIATMIGTASHCVINVNIGGPSMINTEKQREELQYEDKTP